MGEDGVLLFPQLDILAHEGLEIDEFIKVERLKVLDSLTRDEDKIVIASIASLLEVILPAEVYTN